MDIKLIAEQLNWQLDLASLQILDELGLLHVAVLHQVFLKVYFRLLVTPEPVQRVAVSV
jgi:hypothetical protein